MHRANAWLERRERSYKHASCERMAWIRSHVLTYSINDQLVDSERSTCVQQALIWVGRSLSSGGGGEFESAASDLR